MIRYNEGFAGIEKVFNALCVTISNDKRKHFVHLDNSRIVDSRRIPIKQSQIFSNNVAEKQQGKLKYTSALRLLGRSTTYLTQTTSASRLLFASTRHFVPRECEKNWKFSIF